jgi:hypothetical protein
MALAARPLLHQQHDAARALGLDDSPAPSARNAVSPATYAPPTRDRTTNVTGATNVENNATNITHPHQKRSSEHC